MRVESCLGGEAGRNADYAPHSVSYLGQSHANVWQCERRKREREKERKKIMTKMKAY
jgi:hypothetical protein